MSGTWTQAAVLDFEVTSAGPFTAIGMPPAPVSVTIAHPVVVVAAPPLTFFSQLIATETVDFTTSPYPSVIGGAFTFTAFGGEVLQGTFSGLLIPDIANPIHFEVVGPFVFTGGTGLYSGASGGGDLIADIQFLDPNGAFGQSIITWDGKLNLVPEPQQWGLVPGLVGLAIWRRRRA